MSMRRGLKEWIKEAKSMEELEELSKLMKLQEDASMKTRRAQQRAIIKRKKELDKGV